MAFKLLSTALFATFVVLGSASPVLEDRSLYCAKGAHIFATRGHNATDGTIGKLKILVKNILHAIPNSTWINTPYVTDPANPVGFVDEIGPGTEVLTSNVTDYAAACPHTPIILLGYSEGAVITMNVVCGTSSAGFVPTDPIAASYANNIIATVVYGDESRTINQPYNRGTCDLFGTLPRLNTTGCAAFENHIRSWCDDADPDCCVGGDSTTAHGDYFTEYDAIVTGYLQARYQQYRANHPST